MIKPNRPPCEYQEPVPVSKISFHLGGIAMRKILKLVLQVTLLVFEMMMLFVFTVIAQPSLDTNIVARTGLYDSRPGARQHTYNLSWSMNTPSLSLPANPSTSNLANAAK
jgi:hypothetical protein